MEFCLRRRREANLRCSPLLDDGQPDIEGYNKELEKLGYPSWFNIPWLFAECYLYRYGFAFSPSLLSNYN